MAYTVIKFFVSALLVVLISEIGKRSSLVGAIIASLPLLSILAIVWLYVDTKNVIDIITLSKSIFWLVLPSLIFFISLPICLTYGWSFYSSLLVSCLLTIMAYFFMLLLLKHFGVI